MSRSGLVKKPENAPTTVEPSLVSYLEYALSDVSEADETAASLLEAAINRLRLIGGLDGAGRRAMN